MGTNKLCLYEVDLMTSHHVSRHLQYWTKLAQTKSNQIDRVQLCFLNEIFLGLSTVPHMYLYSQYQNPRSDNLIEINKERLLDTPN